jgi:hypothetical protein
MPLNHQAAVDEDAQGLATAAQMFGALTGRDAATVLTERYEQSTDTFEDIANEHYVEATGQPAPVGYPTEVYEAAHRILAEQD